MILKFFSSFFFPRRFAALRCCGVAVVAVVVALCNLTAAESGGSIAEKPLAPRSHARGKTMFTLLTPEQTGIKTENRFADPKMRGELYQEFETSSIGTGVAIGDYDGDGLPDIFVVSKTESCRLFRNLGNYKFEDVTEKAGVADKGDAAMIWKQGAAFADVNNDGRLDIYLCRTNAPNLLYINQGDGTFKEQGKTYGLDIKDSSVMAAFCDYDRDGALDLYITTNILSISAHPDGQRGILLHNNRNGTFSNVTDRAGITDETQSHSATWWDFNNDGWPDLYVANDYGKRDKLYRNNRDGTFTDVLYQVAPHTSFSSMGADVGDVNNDGLIDFLVADMAATNHQKDHHSLADARGRGEEIPDNSGLTPKYHRNALLINTGTGYLQEGAFLANLAATDWTWSLRFEDLDNDGRIDLHVTNGFPRDPGVDVLKKLMSAETPSERVRVMYDSPIQDEVNLALRNRGDLEFENVTAEWGLDQKSVDFGAAFGDLSGDGNMDLVYTNYHSGLTVLRNDNDTGHRIDIDLRGRRSNFFGVGALVKIESALGVQAQQLVVARGYMSSSEPMLHFGLGADTVIKRLIVEWPSGHVQTFQDLPVDRRFTITEPSEPAPALNGLQRDVVGQFQEVSQTLGLALRSREEVVNEAASQPLLPVRLNRRGPSIAVGDLFGKGGDDLVVGGTTLDTLRVLHEIEPGHYTLGSATAIPTGTAVDDGPVLVFDADGDGSDDILVTKGGNALPAGVAEYNARLFLNDGHGSFRPAADDALPALPYSAGAAVTADFDRDGKLDLFIGGRLLPVQYPESPYSALLVNHGGKFEDVTDTLAPALRKLGMVTAALWSDVDGDGWVDLLVALEWGQVKYFHNNLGKGFEDWTEKAGFASAGTGWWTSLAAADFNGDGRMDYAAGNVGLNTQYRADPKHPALLYYGSFKAGNGLQLIEGYYEGERVYPWRTRRDVVAIFPALARRYPTADSYAPATLGQIFGEDKLAKAQRYSATELRSGVFLSQPDGSYRFEPLPRVAQIAPFQGLAAGDFDGDGYPDIYAVQNFFGPIPPVGHFDGGISQLLHGDGHGHFTAVAPRDSNLVVPGDAKGLVVLDLDRDGWPDFVVSRNNSSSLAFRNNGVGGRGSLSVRLGGTSGNPHAVGARVTAHYPDGFSQTAEVYGGSGYYSQSAPVLYFGYRGTSAPEKLTVRWPQGETTEHTVPPGLTVMTIRRSGS